MSETTNLSIRSFDNEQVVFLKLLGVRVEKFGSNQQIVFNDRADKLNEELEKLHHGMNTLLGAARPAGGAGQNANPPGA